jgi:hypothetical protein
MTQPACSSCEDVDSASCLICRDHEPDEPCPAAFRESPMPRPARCAYTLDDHPGTVHRGHDADGHYYTWLSTDSGAYEETL